jgi:hypothetical protein
LSTLAPEISGKQLELLKEIVPRLSRVAVLGNSTDPGNAQVVGETERAAVALGVQHLYLDVRAPEDIETAFRAASKGRADAVLALSSFLFISQRKQLVDLAVKSRLPAIYDRREFVEDGGLMTYSVSQTDLFRRAATYVDKILKGRKPADLPVDGFSWRDPKVSLLDLQYHDIRPEKGVYYRLVLNDEVDRITGGETIEQAKHVPPQTTRARLRGEFIRQANLKGKACRVDWVYLKLNDPDRETIVCKDPFQSHDERIERLIRSF